MSVQFGRWNFENRAVDPEFLSKAAKLTMRYHGEEQRFCSCGPLAMFFQPFQMTKESAQERQPLNPSGLALTWDGRLDNREELIRLLHLDVCHARTDAEIVLAAYMKWQAGCFTRLIGDWAVAIWDQGKNTLLLSKDFAGTRHLFYVLEARCITWSTVLDPLVFLAGRTFEINEEYIAGYLSTYPPTHLTPYAGINAVPAGAYLEVSKNGAQMHVYWNFDPAQHIRYRTDAEYEEHFRSLLALSVRRRLRSSFPVLAELSGGMDSTSIVCMADTVIAAGQAETPRLDTISYFDENEPNWNERPYFSLVEKQRGREGYHIDLGGCEGAFDVLEEGPFCPLPGFDRLQWNRLQEFSRYLISTGSRVLLSGVGGDEFLGGVPLPNPELQDLLARLHWLRFVRQLSKWSLQKRQPWTHLSFAAIEEFLPQAIRKLYKHTPAAPWLSRGFLRSHAHIFSADTAAKMLVGPLPSFQSNVATLDHVRRQLHVSHLNTVANQRVSYPFLDRDLLTFLFAIPREQLLRPHQRRSLMRRALVKIVPQEILQRRRKAYIARQPLTMIQSSFPKLERLLKAAVLSFPGRLDGEVLSNTLHRAKHGQIEQLIPLLGLLKLELWLQSLVSRNLLTTLPRDVKELADGEYLGEKAAVF
jgi:asparagine synthase (glutamine-hydrolysing)